MLPAEWDTVMGVVTLLQELWCTQGHRHTSTHLDAVQWNSKGHRMYSVCIISVDREEEGRRKRRRKEEEEQEDERYSACVQALRGNNDNNSSSNSKCI